VLACGRTKGASSRNLTLSVDRKQVPVKRFLKRCPPSKTTSGQPAYTAAPELGEGAWKANWGPAGNNAISKDCTQLARRSEPGELLFGPAAKDKQPTPRAQVSLLGSGVCSDDPLVLLAMAHYGLSCADVLTPQEAELQDK
jgi:hypothetical protein